MVYIELSKRSNFTNPRKYDFGNAKCTIGKAKKPRDEIIRDLINYDTTPFAVGLEIKNTQP